MEEAHNTIFLPSLLSAIIMDQTPLTFSASFCCFCHGHSSSWATLQCEIVIRLGIHCCAPALQPPSLFALPNKLRDTAADSQSGQFIYWQGNYGSQSDKSVHHLLVNSVIDP